MNADPFVVDIDHARRLLAVGAPQESLFYWQEDCTGPGEPYITRARPDRHTLTCGCRSLAAFTADELLAIMPAQIRIGKDEYALVLRKDSDCFIARYMGETSSLLGIPETKPSNALAGLYLSVKKFEQKPEGGANA